MINNSKLITLCTVELKRDPFINGNVLENVITLNNPGNPIHALQADGLLIQAPITMLEVSPFFQNGITAYFLLFNDYIIRHQLSIDQLYLYPFSLFFLLAVISLSFQRY